MNSSATQTIIYVLDLRSQLSMQIYVSDHLLAQACLIKVKIYITIMGSLRAQTQDNIPH